MSARPLSLPEGTPALPAPIQPVWSFAGQPEEFASLLAVMTRGSEEFFGPQATTFAELSMGDVLGLLGPGEAKLHEAMAGELSRFRGAQTNLSAALNYFADRYEDPESAPVSERLAVEQATQDAASFLDWLRAAGIAKKGSAFDVGAWQGGLARGLTYGISTSVMGRIVAGLNDALWDATEVSAEDRARVREYTGGRPVEWTTLRNNAIALSLMNTQDQDPTFGERFATLSGGLLPDLGILKLIGAATGPGIARGLAQVGGGSVPKLSRFLSVARNQRIVARSLTLASELGGLDATKEVLRLADGETTPAAAAERVALSAATGAIVGAVGGIRGEVGTLPKIKLAIARAASVPYAGPAGLVAGNAAAEALTFSLADRVLTGRPLDAEDLAAQALFFGLLGAPRIPAVALKAQGTVLADTLTRSREAANRTYAVLFGGLPGELGELTPDAAEFIPRMALLRRYGFQLGADGRRLEVVPGESKSAVEFLRFYEDNVLALLKTLDTEAARRGVALDDATVRKLLDAAGLGGVETLRSEEGQRQLNERAEESARVREDALGAIGEFEGKLVAVRQAAEEAALDPYAIVAFVDHLLGGRRQAALDFVDQLPKAIETVPVRRMLLELAGGLHEDYLRARRTLSVEAERAVRYAAEVGELAEALASRPAAIADDVIAGLDAAAEAARLAGQPVGADTLANAKFLAQVLRDADNAGALPFTGSVTAARSAARTLLRDRATGVDEASLAEALDLLARAGLRLPSPIKGDRTAIPQALEVYEPLDRALIEDAYKAQEKYDAAAGSTDQAQKRELLDQVRGRWREVYGNLWRHHLRAALLGTHADMAAGDLEPAQVKERMDTVWKTVEGLLDALDPSHPFKVARRSMAKSDEAAVRKQVFGDIYSEYKQLAATARENADWALSPEEALRLRERTARLKELQLQINERIVQARALGDPVESLRVRQALIAEYEAARRQIIDETSGAGRLEEQGVLLRLVLGLQEQNRARRTAVLRRVQQDAGMDDALFSKLVARAQAALGKAGKVKPTPAAEPPPRAAVDSAPREARSAANEAVKLPRDYAPLPLPRRLGQVTDQKILAGLVLDPKAPLTDLVDQVIRALPPERELHIADIMLWLDTVLPGRRVDLLGHEAGRRLLPGTWELLTSKRATPEAMVEAYLNAVGSLVDTYGEHGLPHLSERTISVESNHYREPGWEDVTALVTEAARAPFLVEVARQFHLARVVERVEAMAEGSTPAPEDAKYLRYILRDFDKAVGLGRLPPAVRERIVDAFVRVPPGGQDLATIVATAVSEHIPEGAPVAPVLRASARAVARAITARTGDIPALAGLLKDTARTIVVPSDHPRWSWEIQPAPTPDGRRGPTLVALRGTGDLIPRPERTIDLRPVDPGSADVSETARLLDATEADLARTLQEGLQRARAEGLPPNPADPADPLVDGIVGAARARQEAERAGQDDISFPFGANADPEGGKVKAGLVLGLGIGIPAVAAAGAAAVQHPVLALIAGLFLGGHALSGFLGRRLMESAIAEMRADPEFARVMRDIAADVELQGHPAQKALRSVGTAVVKPHHYFGNLRLGEGYHDLGFRAYREMVKAVSAVRESRRVSEVLFRNLHDAFGVPVLAAWARPAASLVGWKQAQLLPSGAASWLAHHVPSYLLAVGAGPAQGEARLPGGALRTEAERNRARAQALEARGIRDWTALSPEDAAAYLARETNDFYDAIDAAQSTGNLVDQLRFRTYDRRFHRRLDATQLAAYLRVLSPNQKAVLRDTARYLRFRRAQQLTTMMSYLREREAIPVRYHAEIAQMHDKAFDRVGPTLAAYLPNLTYDRITTRGMMAQRRLRQLVHPTSPSQFESDINAIALRTAQDPSVGNDPVGVLAQRIADYLKTPLSGDYAEPVNRLAQFLTLQTQIGQQAPRSTVLRHVPAELFVGWYEDRTQHELGTIDFVNAIETYVGAVDRQVHLERPALRAIQLGNQAFINNPDKLAQLYGLIGAVLNKPALLDEFNARALGPAHRIGQRIANLGYFHVMPGSLRQLVLEATTLPLLPQGQAESLWHMQKAANALTLDPDGMGTFLFYLAESEGLLSEATPAIVGGGGLVGLLGSRFRVKGLDDMEATGATTVADSAGAWRKLGRMTWRTGLRDMFSALKSGGRQAMPWLNIVGLSETGQRLALFAQQIHAYTSDALTTPEMGGRLSKQVTEGRSRIVVELPDGTTVDPWDVFVNAFHEVHGRSPVPGREVLPTTRRTVDPDEIIRRAVYDTDLTLGNYSGVNLSAAERGLRSIPLIGKPLAVFTNFQWNLWATYAYDIANVLAPRSDALPAVERTNSARRLARRLSRLVGVGGEPALHSLLAIALPIVKELPHAVTLWQAGDSELLQRWDRAMPSGVDDQRYHETLAALDRNLRDLLGLAPHARPMRGPLPALLASLTGLPQPDFGRRIALDFPVLANWRDQGGANRMFRLFGPIADGLADLTTIFGSEFGSPPGAVKIGVSEINDAYVRLLGAPLARQVTGRPDLAGPALPQTNPFIPLALFYADQFRFERLHTAAQASMPFTATYTTTGAVKRPMAYTAGESLTKAFVAALAEERYGRFGAEMYRFHREESRLEASLRDAWIDLYRQPDYLTPEWFKRADQILKRAWREVPFYTFDPATNSNRRVEPRELPAVENAAGKLLHMHPALPYGADLLRAMGTDMLDRARTAAERNSFQGSALARWEDFNASVGILWDAGYLRRDVDPATHLYVYRATTPLTELASTGPGAEIRQAARFVFDWTTYADAVQSNPALMSSVPGYRVEDAVP